MVELHGKLNNIRQQEKILFFVFIDDKSLEKQSNKFVSMQ